MKIEQDSQTGQIQCRLDTGEKYDFDEHLTALSEFVSCQAVKNFRLTKSYRKLVQRLNETEAKITNIEGKQKTLLTNENRRSGYFNQLDDISLGKIAKTYIDEKEFSRETLQHYADWNKSAVFKISPLVYQEFVNVVREEFLNEIMTRFSNQIQIYLNS
ncbi:MULTISPECIES: hypothetical protein [unclassified Microcoleus]|uniref:hypothetical protein n=1 Tax=unclassified Microcoleus TaxID=2642155 RepID=UPI002FD5CE20